MSNVSKFVNINQGEGIDTKSIYSTIKTAGSNISTSTIIIILVVLLFCILVGFYYFYYIAPKLNTKYHANSEHIPTGQGTTNSAELMFFYADWCPHCKTAKPIWEELKTEYQDKNINGHTLVFTEVNCSNETAEVDKLMNQYNVEGYPTIKLIKDGQVIEYDAKPTKETLTQFINTVI